MCGCANDTAPVSFGTYSQDGPCGQINTDTLTLYRDTVQGVITTGGYKAVQSNARECQEAVKMLQDWMAVKKESGDECGYFRYAPVLQDLVKRILLSAVPNDPSSVT
jgi:hypothetical protein